MHTYRNRLRSMLTALVLGAGVAAICGGTAFADQPWTHAGNDHHGGYQGGTMHGNRHHGDAHHGQWRRHADNHGWDHQRRGDWHHYAGRRHAWRHHYRHDHYRRDHTRTAYGYRAYPAPPASYAPPALSFGINIPLGGQIGH